MHDLEKSHEFYKVNILHCIKKVLGVLIPLFIMIIITKILDSDIGIFNILIEIFCASIGLALSIVSLVRTDVKKSEIFKYIGCGFIIISLISYIHIIVCNKSPSAERRNLRYILDILNFYLEYIVIIVSINLYERESGIIKSIVYFFSISAGVIIFNYFGMKISRYELGSLGFSIINILILSILAYFLFYTVLIKKNNRLKEERQYLALYTVFIILHQVLYLFHVALGAKTEYGIWMLKYLAYYILYEAMNKFLLYNSYNEVKRELKSIQTTQEELNNTLMYRNKMLTESKILVGKKEDKYRKLIESISDGVVIFYFEKMYYINKSAFNILGQNIRFEAIEVDFTKFIKNVFDIAVNNIPNVNEMIDKIVNSEEKLHNINIIDRYDRKIDVFFLKIDNLNRIVYMKDVTEINRNHEIRREYDKYLKEEKVKNQFYSNISHELRTPINIIYSALQLNEIYIKEGNYKKIEEKNEVIKQNSLRLIRTINNFIDANKIAEGYVNPHIKVYNIVPIVENITLACNRYLEMVKSNLIFDSIEEEIYVKCDKDMIERIMLNLLSNSVKYGKKGGNLLVSIDISGEKVIINYVDSSYTIDKNMQPYIFDRFTRINKSFTREREGSGLGLYLVKALVELQNGIIEFKSDNKIGTEFKIVFDRSYEEEEISEEIFVMNTLDEKVDIEFSDIYF